MATLCGLSHLVSKLQDAFNIILIHYRTHAHEEMVYVCVCACAHMAAYPLLSSKCSKLFWFYNLDLVIRMS